EQRASSVSLELGGTPVAILRGITDERRATIRRLRRELAAEGPTIDRLAGRRGTWEAVQEVLDDVPRAWARVDRLTARRRDSSPALDIGVLFDGVFDVREMMARLASRPGGAREVFARQPETARAVRSLEALFEDIGSSSW